MVKGTTQTAASIAHSSYHHHHQPTTTCSTDVMAVMSKPPMSMAYHPGQREGTTHLVDHGQDAATVHVAFRPGEDGSKHTPAKLTSRVGRVWQHEPCDGSFGGRETAITARNGHGQRAQGVHRLAGLGGRCVCLGLSRSDGAHGRNGSSRNNGKGGFP